MSDLFAEACATRMCIAEKEGSVDAIIPIALILLFREEVVTEDGRWSPSAEYRRAMADRVATVRGIGYDGIHGWVLRRGIDAVLEDIMEEARAIAEIINGGDE